jgi:hypothetical protein
MPIKILLPRNGVLFKNLMAAHLIRKCSAFYAKLITFSPTPAESSPQLHIPYLSSNMHIITDLTFKTLGKKVKLSLWQAVEAHRFVRRRGSHIFSRQSAHRWRWGCQPYAPDALYPQEDSWYSFLSEAESTPGPQCGWKDLVKWKIQWPHFESNPRPSGL